MMYELPGATSDLEENSGASFIAHLVISSDLKILIWHMHLQTIALS